MALRMNDFPLILERLNVDDETLLSMHEKLLYEIRKREGQYIDTTKHLGSNYLHLTMARLAYGFVKEEYEHVQNEMSLRGMTAS
ncbi:MAG: hypothetical protein LBT59_14685 [Clostridiales bacterium]|jgi:hypothetical protein|nr:hypothetical protein [Clostridiales bacterium]